MMKKSIYISFFTNALLLILGCNQLVYAQRTKANSDLKKAAIHEAISEFSQSCRPFRKHNIFSVSFHDTVYYRSTRIKVTDNLYSSVRGPIYKGVIAVTILPEHKDFKFLITTNDTILRFALNTTFPKEYIIIKNKLFYWDYSDAPTPEMLKVLEQFNMITYDDEENDYPIDDAQKGITYFFCRNNLKNYRRVITSVAMGYYDPPKIRCK